MKASKGEQGQGKREAACEQPGCCHWCGKERVPERYHLLELWRQGASTATDLFGDGISWMRRDGKGPPQRRRIAWRRLRKSVLQCVGKRLIGWSHTVLLLLSDPLDDDFGRTVGSSLVLRVVGDRGLSRGGSFVRRVTVQAVGELRCRVEETVGASNPGRQAVLDTRLFGADGSGGDENRLTLQTLAQRRAGTHTRDFLRQCCFRSGHRSGRVREKCSRTG